jgi:hypothetical protein
MITIAVHYVFTHTHTLGPPLQHAHSQREAGMEGERET